jgi:hypothetical protein
MSALTAADVVARLDGVVPACLEAPALLARLGAMRDDGSLTMEYLVELQPRIEIALAALDAHVEQSERIVERCKSLPPLPGKTVPAGF